MIASTLVLSLLFYSCDKNEFAPVVADQAFSIAENSPQGTLIGTVNASDADEGQVVSFEFIDGNLDGTFNIDPSTGVLSVADATALDYEKTTEFTLNVAVSDNHKKEPFESSAVIKINITDENEFAPGMEPQTFELDENPTSGQEIGLVVASDADTHQGLTYSIVEQNETNYFEIDSQTGSLSVADTAGFDYETSQQLSLTVKVEDDHENPKNTTATITVNIRDLIESSEGLIAFYPFNGNANDESGGDLHGLVYGAELTTDRHGIAQSAYSFDGIGDYISLRSADILQIANTDFSVSVWYEFASPDDLNTQALVSAYNSSGDNREFILGYNGVNDSIFYRLWDQGKAGAADMVWAIKTPGWHLLTITRDATNLSIYLDGVLVDQKINTATPLKTHAEFMIGALQNMNTQPDWFMHGKIDDVYFHNRALIKEEIIALYEME